jgi:hypothetical protein
MQHKQVEVSESNEWSRSSADRTPNMGDAVGSLACIDEPRTSTGHTGRLPICNQYCIKCVMWIHICGMEWAQWP